MGISNTTAETRYDNMGISGYIYQHVKNEFIEKPIVIDVGCSDGRALSECKRCLIEKNIDIYTIGIDPYCDITKSQPNLDKFICKDVIDVDDYQGEADVVICANVINTFYYTLTRLKLLKREYSKIFQCSEKFLKTDGILITDAPSRIPQRFGKKLSIRHDFHKYPLCPQKNNIFGYIVGGGRRANVYKKIS